MSMNSQPDFDFFEKEESINYKEIIGKYLPYWPWFILSVLLAYGAASLFLRYTPVIYKTEAKVKMLEGKEKSNVSLDISTLLNKGSVNLENDIALLKSFNLSQKVVRNLDLNVNYFSLGKISNKQIFDPPFRVKFALDENEIGRTFSFKITSSGSGYVIENLQSGKTLQTKELLFTNPNQDFPISIEPNSQLGSSLQKEIQYEVKISPIANAAKNLSNSLQIQTDGKNSSIILISLQHSDGKKAQKIINNLIQVFEEDGVQDNQLVSKRTIEFVDERFKYISEELNDIEIEKRNFKKNNKISFVEGDAASSIQSKTIKEQALFDMETQLLLAQMLKDNLQNEKEMELLPSNIGIQNGTISGSVDRYNSSLLELEKLKTSAGSNNPAVKLGISQLADQRKNIINSVNSYYNQLVATRNQSDLGKRQATGSFASIPEKERVLREIDRQQNLKESLYLLLLQKREEAAINLAITQPNTKIIDLAITNDSPVYPKRQQVFLLALLAGLVLPFGILYLLFLLDDKIYLAADVERINKSTPILAELPTFMKGSEFEERESLVQNLEAFRTLAHNADFVTPPTEDNKGSVYFVTSAIKGEGKTFVAFNLANAYAHLNKKVLIVGCDLRNPQLHKHLEESRKNNKGLSNYLYDPALNWQNLILKKNVFNFSFDILLAGDIPPNPTLLLSSARFQEFIRESKELYDIIILDTPPTLLVTDSLIISKYAETTIFVLRSGKTEKDLVKYSSKLSQDKKLINIGYVINDIDFKRGYGYGYGYNYGYGYGYGRDVEKISFWKIILNSIKRKKR